MSKKLGENMSTYSKISAFILRVSMGWLFFYAGITKVINPNWSAAGYLNNAKTFSSFYAFLAQPSILPFTNFLNEWGLTLIGISLIIGLFVKYTAHLGSLMMILYYFPVLEFPYPNEHSFIVDEHIIYAAALCAIATLNLGKPWSVDELLESKKKRA